VSTSPPPDYFDTPIILTQLMLNHDLQVLQVHMKALTSLGLKPDFGAGCDNVVTKGRFWGGEFGGLGGNG
jgi:hypothetical protein